MENWDNFAAEYPAESAWIQASAATFGFAAAMFDAVRKWGRLTENQAAAVHKCMMRAAPRQATEIDVSGLDRVFAVARERGAIKAALRTSGVTFSLAPMHGKNPGAIYCKSPDGEYLGKIADGRFAGSYSCTAAHREEVVEASRDPLAAALRYARETDRCSICGKLLTDPESKSRGIGPVCARSFGW